MSGPNIFAPAPGSNAIGLFTIGVSPIGDIIPFNAWQTIISQYSNSPIIDALILNFQQYIDQTYNYDELFDLIWDVTNATGYGLDVWGRIVVVGRTLQIPDAGVSDFGFEEGLPSSQPFNTAPFFGAGGSVTTSYTLTDPAYRTLIYAKALANICSGSIPAINAILLALFPGQGNCFVTDGENMTMTYTFNFALTPVQFAIVEQSGVLPRPVGVTATVVQNIITL